MQATISKIPILPMEAQINKGHYGLLSTSYFAFHSICLLFRLVVEQENKHNRKEEE